MRYSLEPKYRKYVQGYGFLSLARKFGDKYGITASKRIAQKTAGATGDLIGNKIAVKITSVAKSKNNQKKVKQMK